MKQSCFGMMRFVGSIGFIAFSSICFFLTRHLLKVDLSVISVSDLSGKGIVLMVLSVVAGLIGLLIGQGIGLSISLGSDRKKDIIDLFWHFGANGSIAWAIFSTLVMNLSLGRDGTEIFFQESGVWKVSIILIAAGLVLGWAIGLVIYLGSQAGPSLFFANILPIILAVSLGIVQAKIIGASLFFGLVQGALFPFVVIPITMDLIRKDYLRRSTL